MPQVTETLELLRRILPVLQELVADAAQLVAAIALNAPR